MDVQPAQLNNGLDIHNDQARHEIIPCERCGKRIECKANSFTKCQCGAVQLNLNEVQYISENYEGCMCAACLLELKEEYQTLLSNKKTGELK